MINYYEVLGVDNFSDIDKVKKIYRKLSMVYHPDMGGTQKKFIEINTAYGVLNDEKGKEKYDTELKSYIEELNKPKKPIQTSSSKEDINNSYQKKQHDEVKNTPNQKQNNTRRYDDIYEENGYYDGYEYEEEDGKIIDFNAIFKIILNILQKIWSFIRFIFSKNFITFLKESINFKGNIGRMSFIQRILGGFISLFYLIEGLGPITNNLPIVFDDILFFFMISLYVIYFLSNIIKRWNDIGKSKWYLLFLLIPYINFIVLLILVFKKSKRS